MVLTGRETVSVSLYLLRKAYLYLAVTRVNIQDRAFIWDDSILRTEASMDGRKREELPLNVNFNYTTFEFKKQIFQGAGTRSSICPASCMYDNAPLTRRFGRMWK